MPQSQDELLQIIASMMQQARGSTLMPGEDYVQQPWHTVETPEARLAGQREGINKYTQMTGSPAETSGFLGTSPILNLAGALNQYLVQRHFSGEITPEQVYQEAEGFRQVFPLLPSPFVGDVLRSIGYTPRIGNKGEILGLDRIPEAYPERVLGPMLPPTG